MLAIEGHWRFAAGHSLGDPPPPKLMAAVWLVEAEQRARGALEAQAQREKAEHARLGQRHPGADRVAVGR
jgi:hypothetical protein